MQGMMAMNNMMGSGHMGGGGNNGMNMGGMNIMNSGPMQNMQNMNNMQQMHMNNMGNMQNNMPNNFNHAQMKMHYNPGYNNLGSQMAGHINMGRMGGGGGGGHMATNMMQNMGPGHVNMMGARDMGGMTNMPIRAGGPSINMRMPIDPHSRMYGAQGRPSPYPSPQMYMAQKRHGAPGPAMYNSGQVPSHMGGPGGQYMPGGRGHFPGGPQGYPMGHPHNMGGGPGPGFGGMPSNMRGHGGLMQGQTMQHVSSMGGNHPGNFSLGSQSGPGGPASLSPAMRPGGGGQGGAPGAGSHAHQFPGGGPGGGGGGRPLVSMGGSSPGIFPSGHPGDRRIKTEMPNMSPRGPQTTPGGGPAVISSFQHSPVPGNPTPPLTPNAPSHCISAPFASPASSTGSPSQDIKQDIKPDIKPNLSIASKYVLTLCVLESQLIINIVTFLSIL